MDSEKKKRIQKLKAEKQKKAEAGSIVRKDKKNEHGS